jgi:hypothetical protein
MRPGAGAEHRRSAETFGHADHRAVRGPSDFERAIAGGNDYLVREDERRRELDDGGAGSERTLQAGLVGNGEDGQERGGKL